MSYSNCDITDRIKTLELNDKGLRSQISELVAEKEKCEEQIDELGEELDSRVKQLTVNILLLLIMITLQRKFIENCSKNILGIIVKKR